MTVSRDEPIKTATGVSKHSRGPAQRSIYHMGIQNPLWKRQFWGDDDRTPKSPNLQVSKSGCTNIRSAQCYKASLLLPVTTSATHKYKSVQHLPVRPEIVCSGDINPVTDQLMHTSCTAVLSDVRQCNVGCNVSSQFLSILHELSRLLSGATYFSDHETRIISSPDSATAIVNSISGYIFNTLLEWLVTVISWLSNFYRFCFFLPFDSQSVQFNCVHCENKSCSWFILMLLSLILWQVVSLSPMLSYIAIQLFLVVANYFNRPNAGGMAAVMVLGHARKIMTTYG